MSHFTVMVIGDNPEDQLAPYHEFECTGQNDQYIQEIDETQDYKEGYQKYLAELKEAGGEGPVLTEKGWLMEKQYIEEDRILSPDDELETEGNDACHMYGYIICDGETLVKAVRRTNPQAKWDWYQLGGRWQGFLKLKPEYAEAMGHIQAFADRGKPIHESLLEKVKGIKMGSPSLLMQDHKFNRFFVDQAPKGKIDFDGMVNDHLSKVMPVFDEFQSIVNGREWLTWDEAREKHSNIDEAREFFNGQDVIKEVKQGLSEKLGFWVEWETFKLTREQYIARASLQAVSTFALVKDGQWYEKGEMGWFGCASNEKDQVDWSNQLLSILESVSDDTLISIYDCHI